MAEILTESFCERCGTRYTFESPARRSSPLGALGTVGRGLRNFVASGDQSIDEAFAVARAENEQRATAHQLEAFHRTFNFCLSCRQYTCGNCWNPVEGRCQSCAPMPEAEMLPAAEVQSDAPVVAEAMAIARAAAGTVIELPHSHEAGTDVAFVDSPWVENEAAEPDATALDTHEAVAEAWPDVEAWPEPTVAAEPFANLAVEDLDVAAPELAPELAEPDVHAEPEPEPIAEAVAEPEVEVEAIAEPEATAGELEAEPVEPAPPTMAPAPDRRPAGLPALPPGVSLDEEIAAYDLRVAALAEPPVAAATPEAPAVAPGPAPVAPPFVVPTPAPPVQAPRSDELRPAAVQPPIAHIHAEEMLPRVHQGAPQPALPPVYVPGPVPELPAASPAALPASQSTGTCGSCGLALSATARFCRRCGTPQPVA
jgi:hypothetical protein